jgi:SAM-dependent methyltransferase
MENRKINKYPEFIDPYDPASASLFVRAEHLARYLYAADYLRKHHLRTVLDCACGDGYGCRVLAAQAESVSGLERDASRVAGAKATDTALHVNNVMYHIADLDLGLPMQDGVYSCVTCFETLEHVRNDKGLLHEFHRVLARGGRLLLSVPKAGYEPVDASGMPENPHHLRLYEKDGLAHILDTCGFAVEKELGQPYANALHRRAENYVRDTGTSRDEIAGYFNETPQSLEFIARAWAWPEEELPEKSNTIFMVCQKETSRQVRQHR